MQSAASNRLHHIPGLQLGRLQHAAAFTSSPCELARGGRGRGELEARERGRLLEAAASGLGAWGCSLLPGRFCTAVRLGSAAPWRIRSSEGLWAREAPARHPEVSAGERLAGCLWASRNRICPQRISNGKTTPRCALLPAEVYFSCKQGSLQEASAVRSTARKPRSQAARKKFGFLKRQTALPG